MADLGTWAAGASPVDKITNVVDAGIQAYLSTTLIHPTLHQAVAITGVMTSFAMSMRMRAKTGTWGITHKINAFMNEATELLQQPNIEGITIFADKATVGREVEVSSTPVIQQSINSRMFVTDSATPMPRTFSISGYLQSLTPAVDVAHTVKPSIVAQAKYLDSCAMSRCPVWYKDNYNRFFLVLITRFEESHDPTVTSGLRVSIDMQEYIPFVTEERAGSVLNAGMSALFKTKVKVS